MKEQLGRSGVPIEHTPLPEALEKITERTDKIKKACDKQKNDDKEERQEMKARNAWKSIYKFGFNFKEKNTAWYRRSEKENKKFRSHVQKVDLVESVEKDKDLKLHKFKIKKKNRN